MVNLADSVGAREAQQLINRIKPSYPLNIIWFLERLNFELDKQILLVPCDILPEDVSATIIQHPQLGHHYIMYNTSHTVERNRFSIAHEFGHLVLKHKTYSIGDDEDPVLKKEADDFSTELLMPHFKFINAAAINFNLDPISLAMKLRDKRHFWTSLEATCRRLLDLGLFTGAYVLYDCYRRYFVYNSKDFEPCEDKADNINRMLVEFKSTVWSRRIISVKTCDLFFFARRFSNGQMLAAITTKDSIGHNTYVSFAKQCMHQQNLGLAK